MHFTEENKKRLVQYYVFVMMIVFILTYFQCQSNNGSVEAISTAVCSKGSNQLPIANFQISNAKESVLSLAGDIHRNTPLDFESALWVVKYAKQFDLKPSIILAMMDVESHFNQYSVGADQDRGYLQIIPSTEKMLAKNFGSDIELTYDPERIFEPRYNIGLAVCYINFLRQYYGDDYHRILSEYNRGFYNLKKYYKAHKTYETAYSQRILEKKKGYEKFDKAV